MKKVILATFVTFALVDFTWIFFRAGSMHDALYMINSIFTVYNSWIFVDGSIYSLGLSQKQFSLLILLAAEWMKYKKINILDKLLEQEIWFRWTFISSASYLCWCLAQYIILCPICWRERSVQSGFLSFGRIQKNMMSGLWEARFEYICPFSVYHNRWEDLEKRDFHVPISKMKGGKLLDKSVDYSDFRNIAEEDMSDANTLGFQYLEKIVEECQERGIELILTELPFYGTREQQRGMNAVPGFAREHGLVCLNMAYDEGVVDFGEDFGDKAHVNLFGAKKLTKYVGDYLSEHCDLTDYRDVEGIKDKWNADYECYLQHREQKMQKAKKLKVYLQWIGDDRYTCYLYQAKEPFGLVAKELAQLDNVARISLEEAEEKMGMEIQGEYAFIIENDRGEVLDTAVFLNEERQ